LRIGYVNLVRVLEEAPQGIAAQKKLESEFRPRDRELVSLQTRIRHLEEELRKSPDTSPGPDIRNRERELLTLRRELKRSTQEFREDHNQRRSEELATLQKIVQKAIVELARHEKFDLIVSESVLYAGESIDITERVLRKLGKP
jgi:outer membrane protein